MLADASEASTSRSSPSTVVARSRRSARPSRNSSTGVLGGRSTPTLLSNPPHHAPPGLRRRGGRGLVRLGRRRVVRRGLLPLRGRVREKLVQTPCAFVLGGHFAGLSLSILWFRRHRRRGVVLVRQGRVDDGRGATARRRRRHRRWRRVVVVVGDARVGRVRVGVVVLADERVEAAGLVVTRRHVLLLDYHYRAAPRQRAARERRRRRGGDRRWRYVRRRGSRRGARRRSNRGAWRRGNRRCMRR